MAGKNQLAVTKEALNLSQVTERVKRFWSGLDSRQRVYISVGLVITLAVLVFFAKMIATPDYKPLLKGLEAADAQLISAQLAEKKIPYLVSPDGTSISVPADQVDAARLEVASHDAPHSGRVGFEIFDKVSWGQTEFDEKVNYQRALEGELERTIQTIDNVKSARVHIVMPTDSVFIDRERGAKASVTLRLRHGSLSREEISEISRLVAGAVDQLKPTDVVIADADSNQMIGPGTNSADDGDGMGPELTRRLISTLAPVVGADRIRATVNVEYETGSSEESQEKYDPLISVPLNMQRSEDSTGAGAANGGVPGTSSNVPSAKASARLPVTKDLGQSTKSESATYGVNRTTRHTIQPAGNIRRITAAVLLDDAIEHKQENGKSVAIHHKRQPEELRLINELAQAAIGFNSTRGDVISVQNLTFDRGSEEDFPPDTLLDRARKGLNDYSSVVRYGAMLCLFVLVYLLMIRPLQKRALAAPKLPLAVVRSPLLSDPEHAAQLESAASVTQRSLELKKQIADFVKSEPESSAAVVRTWLREETP